MALQAADNPSGFSTAVRDLWLSRNHMSLFTQRSPVWKMMMMRGRIKSAGYGVIMREPLEVPVATGPMLQGVTNAYATIDAQPMTGFTQAEYILSEYAMNVSWQDYDTKRASGPVEMVNWVQAIYKNAHNRAMNQLMNDFWAIPEDPLSVGARNRIMSIRTAINGGTTAATGVPLLPIQANQSAAPVVSASGAIAQTTVGNIPRAAAGAAYWCPSVFRGSPYSPGPTATTVQVLNDSFEEAYQDGYHPHVGILPSALYSKLQNLLTVGGSNGGLVFNESDSAKFGFDSLYFRGARLTVDRRCPTSGFISNTATAVNNHLYFLNLDHLTLRMDGDKPKFKEVVEPKLIHEELGAMYLSLTSSHLGNVHSLNYDLTA
jgi:hypothetical protein